MELIDRDRLMKQVHCVMLVDGKFAYVVFAEDVENAPIIDAVPVVRCKDCIHSKQNDGKLVEGARYCTITFSGTLNDLTAVWNVDYCSNGNRGDVKDDA